MLATTGIILSLDTFGPISDNAQGIVEMAKLSAKAEKITASLDAVGNTTKALTKGFAVGSAAVAASALLPHILKLPASLQLTLPIPKNIYRTTYWRRSAVPVQFAPNWFCRTGSL